jgi:H+/Cl- antiporter ClcA
MVEQGRGRRPKFGPIDPFCLPLVAALAGVAVVLVVAGAALIGVVVGLLAVLVVVFDSWVNRDASRRRSSQGPY